MPGQITSSRNSRSTGLHRPAAPDRLPSRCRRLDLDRSAQTAQRRPVFRRPLPPGEAVLRRSVQSANAGQRHAARPQPAYGLAPASTLDRCALGRLARAQRIRIDAARRARRDVLLQPVNRLGERTSPLVDHTVRPHAPSPLTAAATPSSRRVPPAERRGHRLATAHLSGPVAHRLLVRREPCLVMSETGVEISSLISSKSFRPVALP